MGKDKRLLLKSEIKFSPVCGFVEVSPSPLFSAFSSALMCLSDIKVMLFLSSWHSCRSFSSFQ